jgi:hypothetical protein
MIPGFKPWPSQASGLRPRLRAVGFCIRSVVVILPVGSITPVGIRDFDIPGNPGSPGWLSALRLPASPCFGFNQLSCLQNRLSSRAPRFGDRVNFAIIVLADPVCYVPA